MPKPEPLPAAEVPELEQIQLDIESRRTESLGSTRRMVELCTNAKECGIKSLVALDDQREKLENFEKGMRDIYEDMVEAEQAMNSMGAPCWGLCVPCTEALQREPDPECFKEPKTGGGERREGVSMEGIPTYAGFIAKYGGDKDACEGEMEKNMEEVSNCIGNLRNMAIDMEKEITMQNEYVVRIQDMMDDQQRRIDIGNERAAKLN